MPLQYDPGSRWHYSVSVDVQGALVEAVSGMSFGEFLKTRLFEPLGMQDTSFVVPAEKWPRVAQLYSPKDASADFSAFLQADLSDELVVADDALNASYREGAKFGKRRRRADVHRARLPAFLPNDAEWGANWTACASCRPPASR